MNVPKELKYSQDHEWVKVDGKRATVGITDFAQDQLGDVVFVEVPKVGTAVIVGKAFSVVESVKAVSDIYAPVSGVVVAVNEALNDTPETVNKDPYGEGWIAVIDQLHELPAKRLIPGHGHIPDDWKAALDKEKRYLSTLLADIRASIKKGIVMEKTMDTAAAGEKENWLLFEIVNRRNVNLLYPALEWE